MPKDPQWLCLPDGAATKEACSALAQEANDMAHFYNTHCKEASLYEVRDKVWLNGQNITTTHPMKKLDHKLFGPYIVDKVILRNAYRLKLPPSFGWTHLVFLITLLWPYSTDAITKQVQHNPPPPIVCDGVKEYEVESILDSWIFWGKLEYLICWKGYGIEEDKWRPLEDVKGVRRLITKFHRRNPEAPQHISAIDFSTLPFHPLTNFMDTLHTFPSGWAMCWHMCRHHAFEGGECQGSFSIRLYQLTWAYVIQ